MRPGRSEIQMRESGPHSISHGVSSPPATTVDVKSSARRAPRGADAVSAATPITTTAPMTTDKRRPDISVAAVRGGVGIVDDMFDATIRDHPHQGDRHVEQPGDP